MRLGWAVSGRGATLQAVIAAQRAGLLDSAVTFVLTDRPSEIEAVAEQAGIAWRRVPFAGDRAAFDAAQHAALAGAGFDWLGLTYNWLLKPPTIAALGSRIFNLHLALLPLFPGAAATRRAIDSGMRIAGVTIHQVDAGMDTGPILAQASCPILTGDDVAALGRRQFEAGLPLTLQVVRAIETGGLRLDEHGRPVWPAPSAEGYHGSWPAIDPDLGAFAARFARGI